MSATYLLAKINAFWKYGFSAGKQFANPHFQSEQLNNYLLHIPALLKKEGHRPDLLREHYESIFSPMVGLGFTCANHNYGIRVLGLSGASLEGLMLLRPQIEALLIFFYFIECKSDLKAIEARVEKFNDWIQVKMRQNHKKSKSFDWTKFIYKNRSFEKTVRQNYDSVKAKYKNDEAAFLELCEFTGFLTSKEKLRLAKDFDILGLYNHIVAEASASIHVADLYDRMIRVGDVFFQFRLKDESNGFWPMSLSNLLLFQYFFTLSEFMGAKDTISKDLLKIFAAQKKKGPAAKGV